MPSSPSSRASCAESRGTHAHEVASVQGARRRANSLGRPETKTTTVRTATTTHATRARRSQPPRKEGVVGGEARALIPPTTLPCSLVPSLTTPLYSTNVSKALRGVVLLDMRGPRGGAGEGQPQQ